MGYSDDAYAKLVDLYQNHSHQCGSRVAATYPALTPTDCITYVINVISYAFEKNGGKAAANRVRQLGKHGNELATFLVSDHGWKGIYINPDVNHPRDGKYEHILTYKQVVAKSPYYKIPIDQLVVNYTPTSASSPDYKSFGGKGMSNDPTDEDDSQMDELRKIKFGMGISRGGWHTWLYSLGSIYEVHWDKVGADLYGKTDIEKFEWCSGAIVVPPDAYTSAHFDKVGQGKTFLDYIRDVLNAI